MPFYRGKCYTVDIMKSFWRSRSFIITVSGLAIAAAATWYFTNSNNVTPLITATVEDGDVRQSVAVSATVKAENTAELAFPTSGTVTGVFVRKGDVVATGTRLVTLDAAALQAEVLDARAAVASAVAKRDALLAGARSETRNVTKETIIAKEAALAEAVTDEAQKVTNSLRTLLSSDLEASTDNPGEDAVAPIISGTYLCSETGSYKLSFYRSGEQSGYSVRVTGLEQGTYPTSNEHPNALGTCGLRVQITPNENYQNTTWTVSVPNTKSSSYITNKNTYDLALVREESVVETARRELTLARAQGSESNAPARPEDLTQANAAIAQAQARLVRAVAFASDATLVAPFSGTIVSIDAVAGEAVATAPVVTLLSADRFELIARVPEIDIGKLNVGQSATVLFDTAPDEELLAKIDFISPSATTIDGVAYYETRLALGEIPPWLRSGLSADVDIIIEEKTGLRIPRRFITETSGKYSVLVQKDVDMITSTPIEVELMGNDGYAVISGLSLGDIVVAP